MKPTTLQIDLKNITIQLPSDKIIVDRSEYEELKKISSKGRYLTLSEVLELLFRLSSMVTRKRAL